MPCKKPKKVSAAVPIIRKSTIKRQPKNMEDFVPRRSTRILERSKSVLPPANTITDKNICLTEKKTPRTVKSKAVCGRPSARGAWGRAFLKYSPSKQVTQSPLKCSQGNLKSILINDSYIDMFNWTVNMSENHYYDNAFLLLSSSKNSESRMALILHRASIGVDLEFFNQLSDVTFLGNGAFGNVYSCVDPKTKIKYAIKHISAKSNKKATHASHILSYMAERNANIQAMNSSFTVAFFFSMQIDKTGDCLLFFEYCIGDLENIVQNLKIDNARQISLMFAKNKENLFDLLFQKNLEMLEVCFLYIFEVFCGLDFLVTCNIIHMDLKPENIMVSDNLHLKIGDFGLTNKMRTIHRRTNRTLVNSKLLHKLKAKDYDILQCGTLNFNDFELHLLWLEMNNNKRFLEVFHNKVLYDTPLVSRDVEVLESTFLMDTWAAGIIAVLLLFRGFYLFHPSHLHDDVLTDVPKKSLSIFIVNLVAQTYIYNRYIRDALVKAGGRSHQDLMKFIASIFKPRLTRCNGYTKEKEVYNLTKVKKMKYVDMDKVEQIKTFSDRHFSRSNIHLRSVPENIRKFFKKSSTAKSKNFQDFFKKISSDTSKDRVMSFNPGVTINFFN